MTLPSARPSLVQWLLLHHDTVVASIALAGIATHLLLRFAVGTSEFVFDLPLWFALVLGGIPVLIELGVSASRGKFGADWLAGLSIVTSIFLNEYLA